MKSLLGALAFLATVWSLGFLFGWTLGRWRQAEAENQGEVAVRRHLTRHFTSPDYHLLNHVTLPTDDGTTEIDHILVSRFGIFVLESKHYKGWIFGNSSSSKWTQVLFRVRYRFQNPIHQNWKHVATVAKLLDFLPAEHIHSVVVFTGDATFKTEKPPGVVSIDDLKLYLDGFKVEALTENRLQFFVGRLECHRKALTQQTDVEHVAHLRRKFGDAA